MTTGNEKVIVKLAKQISVLKKEIEELKRKEFFPNKKYEFELDKKGNLLLVYHNRKGKLRKEKLPSNSLTQWLLNKLKIYKVKTNGTKKNKKSVYKGKRQRE